MFCVFLSSIGSFVLRWCLPSIGWSFLNLALFVIGAWVGSGSTVLVWGPIASDRDPPSLLAVLAVTAIAGTLGGAAAVALRKRFAR
jgi:hypothetical protein